MDMQFVSAGLNEFTLQSTPPAPYMRKTFNLDFKPEKATVRMTTNGFYRLFINGKEIIMEEGDSLIFDSQSWHGMKALDGKEAKFLAIVSD